MSYQADRPFTLYFVRHGVTEPNFRGYRCGGDVDTPLMDIGCDQAYLLAKQLERMNLGIGVIVAGSLIRTRQTASIISGVLGDVPVEIDPMLNERRLGEWNNRPIADTEEMLAAKITPPGGESEDEFHRRVAVALHNLQPYFDRRPLIVSSKGVGRVLNDLLGGQGRMQVGNGEIVEFVVSPEAQATSLLVRRPTRV
ncbi:MAG TPA: histidine phosphatase family protein [Usitatibacter sp.]|nr:histidine phosphatase family protein [Usitatibacter sp.]